MKLRMIKMEPQKEGKMQSAKIRVSCWMSAVERGDFEDFMEDTARILDKNMYGSSIFRNAWIGGQVRRWAAEKGYAPDELLERVEIAIGSAVITQLRKDRVEEKSLSTAAMMRSRYRESAIQREKEFDDMLMEEITITGAAAFIEAYEDLDDFDPRVWMTKVGMTYVIPWRERVRMLLSLYLTDNGPTEKAKVIEWATEIKLIGGAVTLNDFNVAASQLGFSGAAEYGRWAVPEGHRLSENLKKVDIGKVTDATLMTAVTTDDTILIG